VSGREEVSETIRRIERIIDLALEKMHKDPERAALILRKLAIELYETSKKTWDPELKNLYQEYAYRALELSNRITAGRKLSREELSEKTVSEEYEKSRSEIPEHIRDLIVVEKPSTRFSDLVDLEEAREALIEAILPIFRPDLARAEVGWRAILLVGPPGTGKTTVAKAAAGELDLTFIYFELDKIVSKWFGETEKNLKSVFELAYEKAPSMIFIDEIDALRAEEDTSGVMTRVDRLLRTELAGFKSSNKPVVVLAATNYPWMLSAPLLSRFERKIYIPLPDRATRKHILEFYIKKFEVPIDESVNLDEIAAKTYGYSGRELVQIIKYAYFNPIRQLIREYGVKLLMDKSIKPSYKVTQQDFLEALTKIKPSATKEYLNRLDRWLKENQVEAQIYPKD